MKNLDLTPGRILIVQTAFVGDVILTLPLLQTAKSLFPDAKIDFLAIPAARNILETVPDIHQLLIYDKRGEAKGAANFFRWIKKLRKNRYYLALVPHRSLRSAALVWGAGIPRRIGFDRSAGRILFSRVIKYPRGVHEINRNLHLLKPFGVDVTKKVFPRLYFTGEDDNVVQGWLREKGIADSAQIIAIAPGSVWATKRWLPEYFTHLAGALADSGYKIVLIGGPADEEVANIIKESAKPPVYNAAGKFSLRQSALLIRRSRLLISNDSAPVHLAGAVGTPIVAIFGPTVPAFGFSPYGDKDRVAEIKDLSCRPCGSHGGDKCPIGTFECMKKLTPELVLREVQTVLGA